MIGTVRRALSRSPRELAGRTIQAIWQHVERSPLPLDRPLVAPTVAAQAARALMEGRTPFFPAFRGIEGAAVPGEGVRAHEAWVLQTARQVRDGWIPILGHGPVFVGSPPRWHVEPLAKREAPRRHWSRVPYLDRLAVGDHKVLWEFNRHQHLLLLAQAWRFTGDTEWLGTIAAHLRSWMDENPPRQGVNWASSLEVAYRSIAWLWTLVLCGPEAAAHFRDDLLSAVLRSLQAHGRHVERYLSHWFSPNTHLTGEALGLLYLAVAVPALPESRRWFALARAILRAQLFVQVAEDGVYFEQATQYHRYTCDIYLHALVLASLAGRSFDAAAVERVHQAFRLLRALQRPDGTMALLGDDDGGRLLPLDAEQPHELNGLLCTAAAWFGDAALLPVGPSHVQRLALLGDRALPVASAAPSPRSAAFSVGGQYVMADRTPSGGHLTLSCGPHGALSCGHSHSDELAFELWTGGAPLFVDHGTLAYDGPARNEFRATSAHNTLELGGEGVSLPGAGAFRWSRRVDATCTSWVDRGQWTWFEGHHDGYGHLATGARHSRAIWRPADGLWLVEDTVAETGGREVLVRWHLAPGTQSIVGGADSGGWVPLALHRDGTSPVTMLVHGADTLRVYDSTVSPQYGKALASRSVVAAVRAPTVTVTTLVVDWSVFGGSGLELSTPEGQVLLAAAHRDEPPTARGPIPALVLGASERSAALDPPVPLERLMAFQRAAGAGVIGVGRSAAAPSSAPRDTWYEGTAVGHDTVRWVHGALRAAGREDLRAAAVTAAAD